MGETASASDTCVDDNEDNEGVVVIETMKMICSQE